MRTVEWHNGVVRMIDQKALPWKMEVVDLPDYQAVAAAITDMTVRGAPAIGASAAFGMALAAKQSQANNVENLLSDLEIAATILKAARPTAVNLAWGVDRLMTTLGGVRTLEPRLSALARRDTAHREGPA